METQSTHNQPSNSTEAKISLEPVTTPVDASKTTTTTVDAESKVAPNVHNGQEPSNPSAVDSVPPSLSATLQSHIQALSALHARMTALRTIPWRMLRIQTQSQHTSLLGVGGVPQLAGSGAGVGLGSSSAGSQGTNTLILRSDEFIAIRDANARMYRDTDVNTRAATQE